MNGYWKGGNWGPLMKERIRLLGPLVMAIAIASGSVARWMDITQTTAASTRRARERERLLDQWELRRRSAAMRDTEQRYLELMNRLPDGEDGTREALMWIQRLAAERGATLRLQPGTAETFGRAEDRVERVAVDLEWLPVGTDDGRTGGTEDWTDFLGDLLLAELPVQVVKVSMQGAGRGLSQCQFSILLWVRGPSS